MGYLGTYRGDYLGSYRGDPGLFGFLGKAVKGVASLGGKLLGGAVAATPIGMAGTAIARTILPSRPPSGLPLPGGLQMHPMAAMPGGRPFVTKRAAGVVAVGPQGQCPPGYHPNKQDGRFGPAGTYCVRNRRMNPGNLKAGRRSARRIASAEKHLRTFIAVKKKVRVRKRRR